MNRLSQLDPANLTPEQQKIYDSMRTGPRGDLGLVGPFNIWARAPIGNDVQTLGAAVRFSTKSISEAVKEIAICTVGVHFEAKFEFAAHRRLAMQAGVSEAVLDGIHAGDPRFDDPDQEISYRVATQLLAAKRVDDDTYSQALNAFGENGMIELVSIIGYYCLVSLTLNLFQVQVTDTMTDPFPDQP